MGIKLLEEDASTAYVRVERNIDKYCLEKPLDKLDGTLI